MIKLWYSVHCDVKNKSTFLSLQLIFDYKLFKSLLADKCSRVRCHPDAQCTDGYCFCPAGFEGDGYYECKRITQGRIMHVLKLPHKFVLTIEIPLHLYYSSIKNFI